MTDVDPFAHDPKRWVGRTVSFDKPGTESPTSSERLTGIVLTQTYAGRTLRGSIPDYRLKVQGKSGRTLEISLVESHASFPT